MKLSNKGIFIYLVICLFLILVSFDKILDPFAIDFRSFYLAAKSVSLGHNPYDLTSLPEVASFKNYVYPYVYTPFLAQFLSLFDSLDFQNLLFTCRLFSILLFAFALLKLVKHLGMDLSSLKTSLIIASSILLSPARYVISSGQVDLVVLSLLILNYTSSLSTKVHVKSFISGLYLAVAILVKIVPAVLLIYFAIKNWRVLIATAIWLLVFIILSMLIFGTDSWILFADSFFQNASNPNLANIAKLDDIQNSSLLSLVLEFSLDLDKSMLIQKLILLFCLIYISFIAFKSQGNNHLKHFGLFLIIMLFSLPFLWRQHFIYLFPLLFILIKDFQDNYKTINLILSLLIGVLSYNSIQLITALGFDFNNIFFNHLNIGILIFIFMSFIFKKRLRLPKRTVNLF